MIFSGSSARKPVAQATVELVFDNSDHTVTGEFAAYNEISVKRTVGRDGQSTYYLNGGKCRRRDITDLFLGTGLGPRSYSIIEQGMISQIIEARPEDLRVYRWKRRHLQVQGTAQGNREPASATPARTCDRPNDLREEVGNGLEHLARRRGRPSSTPRSGPNARSGTPNGRRWSSAASTRMQSLREALSQEETRLQRSSPSSAEAEREIETGRAYVARTRPRR